MTRRRLIAVVLIVVVLAVLTWWLWLKSSLTGGPAMADVSRAELTVVRRVADMPTGAPTVGTYRIHLIDVGTGLSILIHGHDFTMLFDGGSADDKGGFSGEANSSRLLAYLSAALGVSGPARCVPDGDAWAANSGNVEQSIDHVVLSHPHGDHGSMLDEVLACFHARNIWDSGAVNPADFYESFLTAVGSESGATYHTVAPPLASRRIPVVADHDPVVIDPSVSWSQFREGDHVVLGERAWFDVLFADAEPHDDYNQNSIVLRVQLGDVSLLLVGDAESGVRRSPSKPVGETEEYLLQHHRNAIDVDILQVGHHGSETSTRLEFLRAVSPTWALISAGPKKHRTVVHPDSSVVSALTDALGGSDRLLRTDQHDSDGCPVQDRIGVDDDTPGGCDNYVLTVRFAR